LFDQAATHLGVKPKPMAPVYDPDLVAKAILYAAEHRTRELNVGGGGKLLTTLESCAGPVVDRWLVKTGAKGQQSQEPKPEGAAHNLFAALPGQGRVRGSFKGRNVSLYTTARLHPQLTRSTGTIMAALGLWWVRRRRAAQGQPDA
jgi:hypothetical protein